MAPEPSKDILSQRECTAEQLAQQCVLGVCRSQLAFSAAWQSDGAAQLHQV